MRDSPNGTQGPELVFIVAEAPGNYRLEVRSLEKDAAAGRYQVRIEELRAATAQDKTNIAAERALAEAKLLRAQRTAEASHQAIVKYEEALRLWQSTNALRQAQISMLRQPEWRLPYYWGAFILQGEWR